jgi:hypothetical protein
MKYRDPEESEADRVVGDILGPPEPYEQEPEDY